jgi:hypothetical protein
MARSPIFRHLKLKEVKKKTNTKFTLVEELNAIMKEEKEILKNHHDPSYSNWRSSFLFEGGMTTDGFMQTQLKGEGDTDLATIPGNVESSYQAYEGGSDALSNTAITASGTGSGTDGGFDLGQNYLGFNGNSSPRYAALKAIDASKFDTIVVTGIRGNDNNGGEDPDATDEDLMVYYQLPGQNTIQRLDVSGGVTQSGIDYKIIPVGSDDSGLQEYSLTIPSYARADNVRFILYQPTHHGVGFDNYGITQINYRRVKPISVFVSLDSPEASSFMRLGSSPSTLNKSKKEREKELREQLEASKDYTDKKFGENFPGSETPAPGEEDPTEQAKRAPGLGEFEPEVVEYNAWKQETKAEDPQAKTTPQEFEKWKDEKALKSFAKVRDAQQGGVLPSPPSPPTPPVDAQDTKSFDTFQKVSDLHATPGVTDAEKEVGARIAQKEPEEIKAALKDMEKVLKTVEDETVDDKTVDDYLPKGLKDVGTYGGTGDDVELGLKVANSIGQAGKVYINYLLGNLKDGSINNEFLGQKYVNDLIKDIDISKGHGVQSFTQTGSTTPGYIFVAGDNVIGSGGTPTYDPKTGIVTFPFNYDFNTNFEEIYGNLPTGKFDFNTDDSLSVVDRIKGSNSQQIVSFLGMFAAWVLGGKYGLDSVPIPGAGYATWLAKLLGKAQGTTDHAITMSLDDIKKLNPDLAKQLKDTGILRSSEEWQGTEEQKENLYKDITDLYDTDPDRFGEVMQEVDENPEYVKAEDEYNAAEEKFKLDKEERKRIGNEWYDLKQLENIGDVYSNLLRSLDPSTKYGGDPIYGSYRTRYGAGSFAQDAEKIAKLGGIDYKEVQKLQKDYALLDYSKYKFTPAQKNASGGYISYSMMPEENWAMDQKEYKQAAAQRDSLKKEYDAASTAYDKALDPVLQLNKQLAHPTKKGYITGTPSQLAEYNRLVDLSKKARDKWTQAGDKWRQDSAETKKIFDELVNERKDAEKKLKEMSKEADDNIKTLIKDLKSQMDELDKGGVLGKFDPDGELMNKLMSAWDKAAYDLMNPEVAQISDTSAHGRKVASAIRDKLLKSIEDAAKRGDTEAVEKAQEKLKDHDDKQLPLQTDPLDGTQIARYKKPAYTPPYVQDWKKLGGGGKGTSPTGTDLKDWDPNAKIKASTQKDYGSLAQAYGGQGVDAATLASTATATKKKKKKIASSYKPKGSMIIEKRNLKSPNQFFNADDIKPDYPKDPPPDMVDGKWHPDLVDSAKTAEKFNKLDPASAKAMPKTGDPNIDAKVEKAKNNPDKDGPEWHKKVTDKIKNRNA